MKEGGITLTDESKQYQETLHELTDALSSLSDLEEELTMAASRDDTATIDTLVRKSEPLILRFKGLDKKRTAQEKAMGYTNIPFSEFMKHLPEDEQMLLAPSVTALRVQLDRFSEAQERAERIMRVRLFDINLRIADLPGRSAHETRA